MNNQKGIQSAKKVEETRFDTKNGNGELKAYPSGLIYRRHTMSASHVIHIFRCQYRWSMEHARIIHVCRYPYSVLRLYTTEKVHWHRICPAFLPNMYPPNTKERSAKSIPDERF